VCALWLAARVVRRLLDAIETAQHTSEGDGQKAQSRATPWDRQLRSNTILAPMRDARHAADSAETATGAIALLATRRYAAIVTDFCRLSTGSRPSGGRAHDPADHVGASWNAFRRALAGGEAPRWAPEMCRVLALGDPTSAAIVLRSAPQRRRADSGCTLRGFMSGLKRVVPIGLTPNGTTCRRSWVHGRPRRDPEGSGKPPLGCGAG
jgi:hypothetical protein